MKQMQLADGRRLAWRESGEGLPLVLLHGWSMSSVVFPEVRGHLDRQRRVLAPDLAGHGRSAPAADYGLAALARDLEQWLAALDCPQVDLLGWSLGGQVALELALGGRVAVRRLILVAATPRFMAAEDWPHGLPPGQVRAMARDLRRNYQRTLGEFFKLQFAGEDLSGGRLRQILAFAVRPVAPPPLEVALATLETLRRTDLRPRLDDLRIPTLVHQGNLDTITLPGAGKALADLLPCARLASVPGVGHAPFFSDPQAAARIWQEFLA
jgi:pimeloyl-[acyl-carrier protein] methyl ester esterase